MSTAPNKQACEKVKKKTVNSIGVKVGCGRFEGKCQCLDKLFKTYYVIKAKRRFR